MNANSIDLESISTSSSQISTARVLIHGLGRNRLLRLGDGCRRTEIGASPVDETERLWDSWVRVRVGVEGFPHKTTTEDTNGEAE